MLNEILRLLNFLLRIVFNVFVLHKTLKKSKFQVFKINEFEIKFLLMNFESECESGFDLFLNNWEKSETKTFRPTLSKYFNWTWCFKHVSQTRRLNIWPLLLFYFFLNIINKVVIVREDSRSTKNVLI